MNTDYRNSHLQPGKGQAYHDKFLNNPYRKMVWELEKRILDEILSTFYKDIKIYHLDFACGTGRILHYLAGRVSCSVGVDLSPSMIEVASRNNKTSEIIQTDITRNDVLGERKFNLITAFRFFPNAQPALRVEAMQAMKNTFKKMDILFLIIIYIQAI